MENLSLDNNLLNSFKAFVGSHFMFNVVNTVQSDLLLSKPKDAFQSLQIFNRLYKHSVRCSNEQTVSLKDEVVFLNQYLAMEHLRFSGLRISTSVTTSNLKREAVVPTFVFQSFVENAVLLSMEDKGAKNIEIRIEQKGDEIILLIGSEVNSTVLRHLKIESKIQLAEARLVLLRDKKICSYRIENNDSYFLRLSIICSET